MKTYMDIAREAARLARRMQELGHTEADARGGVGQGTVIYTRVGGGGAWEQTWRVPYGVGAAVAAEAMDLATETNTIVHA